MPDQCHCCPHDDSTRPGPPRSSARQSPSLLSCWAILSFPPMSPDSSKRRKRVGHCGDLCPLSALLDLSLRCGSPPHHRRNRSSPSSPLLARRSRGRHNVVGSRSFGVRTSSEPGPHRRRAASGCSLATLTSALSPLQTLKRLFLGGSAQGEAPLLSHPPRQHLSCPHVLKSLSLQGARW